MRTLGTILLGGMGLYGLLLYKKANAANKLVVSFSRFKNISANLTRLTFDLIFSIQNVTAENIQLNGIGGSLYFNNTLVGAGASKQTITLQRQTATELVVPCIVNFSDVPALFMAFVSAFKSKGAEFYFDGMARAVGFNIPFTATFTIK